jgi:hypothetical protein
MMQHEKIENLWCFIVEKYVWKLPNFFPKIQMLIEVAQFHEIVACIRTFE